MELAKLNVVIGAEIDQFEKQIQTLEKGIGRLGDKLKGAGEAMTTYVTLPLSLLAGASLKAAGDMQALEKGFNAVYKGAGNAADELARVKEVAKLPGLGLKEAIQGSINLQAAGFSADQARSALTGFGNALATVGKGKADLDGVTAALSQMAAKGKISAEEINQISERVPQIRKVMQQAFGTADTEALSKMGIGVDEFVSKVTTELNKLPPVSGGINNAFENMADTGLLAMSTLGNAINKAFDIEGILGKISDVIAGVVSWFEGLGPVGQKTTLILGGLAAAAGPLLFAIGGIISALPVLIAGFAAVTGPIGLTIAAIAAGAALIIANWDTITSYFKSSGAGSVFTDLKNSVIGAFDSMVVAIQDFVTTARPYLEAFADVFTTYIGEAFKYVSVVFGAAFDVISRTFKIWSAVFRGDWTGVWQGLANGVISVLNGITKVFTAFVSGTIRVLGSLGKALNIGGAGEGFAKSLGKGAASVESFGKSLQLAYLGNEKLADSNKKTAGSLAEAAKEANELNQAFTRTPKEVKVKVKIEKIGKIEGLEAQLAEEIKKIKPSSVDGFSVDSLLNAPKIGSLGTDIGMLLPAGFEERLAAISSSFGAATGSVSAFKESIIDLKARAEDDIANFFTDRLGPAINGIGDALFNAFSGEAPGKEFFKSLIKMFAQAAAEYGKLTMALGVAKVAIGDFSGIGAIAAGAALIAAAGIATGLASKGGASGGGATGGGGSYSAPTNRASSQAVTSGRGALEITGETRILGNDLVVVFNRAQNERGRTQ